MENIENKFIRDHFMWDTMDDVEWDLVRNALSSAERVLMNADKFPMADFDYLEKQALECGMFLLCAPLAAEREADQRFLENATLEWLFLERLNQ